MPEKELQKYTENIKLLKVENIYKTYVTINEQEVDEMEYKVNFTWDDEASVWIAQSDDIPGLVLEGGSLDALIERVRFAAPELIELNKSPTINSLYFTVERHEKVFA